MKLIASLAVEHVKKKEQVGYLEYSFLMIKFPYISPQFQHFSIFMGDSHQGVAQLVTKPFDIFQT